MVCDDFSWFVFGFSPVKHHRHFFLLVPDILDPYNGQNCCRIFDGIWTELLPFFDDLSVGSSSM